MATETGRRAPRRARSRRSEANGPLYAAIDLGTNNCRLLIAQPKGQSFAIVDSFSQIARLGEGLTATGRLSEAAMARAMDALARMRARLKSHGVGHVRCIATEACRKAENGPDFIARVQRELGLSFKIIGPKEEARLALIGCHDLIEPKAERVLIVDVGGGSTEISLVDVAELRGFPTISELVERAPMTVWTSIPLGVVTLSEAVAARDTEAATYEAMRQVAREALEGWTEAAAVRAALANRPGHLIGTSGTVTCLAGVHLELKRYRRDAVDGTWLARDAARATIGRLCQLGEAGRARLPTVGPERAGLMMSGCAIMDAAWDLFPEGRLRVADRGLREGLLLSMMYGPRRRRRRGGRARGKGQASGVGAPEEAGQDVAQASLPATGKGGLR